VPSTLVPSHRQSGAFRCHECRARIGLTRALSAGVDGLIGGDIGSGHVLANPAARIITMHGMVAIVWETDARHGSTDSVRGVTSVRFNEVPMPNGTPQVDDVRVVPADVAIDRGRSSSPTSQRSRNAVSAAIAD
jgi:hypothetical protein